MRDLKAAFSVSLDDKYIIHPLHKLATLISPTFNYLTFVDAAERDEIYAQMRAKVDSLASTDETDVTDGRGRRTMCHSCGFFHRNCGQLSVEVTGHVLVYIDHQWLLTIVCLQSSLQSEL